MRVNNTFKSMNDDKKMEILFFNIPIVKPNKNISIGCQLTLKSSTTTGDLIIEMSKQSGFVQKGDKQLPTFDHKNKCFFTLSPFESAKIVKKMDKIERLGLDNNKANNKLEFAHKNAKNPKFINVTFSEYNDKSQIQVEVNAKKEETSVKYSIYLDEGEGEVLKEFLKSSYSPIYRKIYTEALYDAEYEERFKNHDEKINGFLNYFKDFIKKDKEFKNTVMELLKK